MPNIHEKEPSLDTLITGLTQKEDVREAIKSAKALFKRADPASTNALARVLASTSLEEELKTETDRLMSLKDGIGISKLIEEYGPTILELKKYIALALLRIGTPEALQLLEDAEHRQSTGKFTSYAIKLAQETYSV